MASKSVKADMCASKKPQSSTAGFLGFSQEQLLLAAKLVESKPTNMSFADYAANLKSAMSVGTRPDQTSLRFIDGAAYWKNQCADNVDEIHRLKARIVQLEDEALAKSLDTSDPAQSQDSVCTRHNSHTMEGQSQNVAGLKRRRVDISDGDQNTTLITEDALIHVGDNGSLQRISSYLFQIKIAHRRIAQLPQAPTTGIEIQNSSTTIVQVIDRLTRSLREICHGVSLLKDHSTSKRGQVVHKVIDQIILTFLSCVGAFDNICNTILGRDARGPLIYQVSDFFRTGLQLLHELSAQQYEQETKIHQTAQRKQPKVVTSEYMANKQISRLLCSIVYNIPWNSRMQVHGELLEGILFVVLNHTATLLSHAVFGEAIADSSKIGHITNSSELNDALSKNLHHSEIRYIIQILHNAMGGHEKKELFLQVIANAKLCSAAPDGIQATTRSPASSSGPGLMTRVRKVLQSTLISGALGVHDGETLCAPVVPAGDTVVLSEEHGQDLYGPEWFCEKVWGLIGWDLII